jgi:hypothetical protein
VQAGENIEHGEAAEKVAQLLHFFVQTPNGPVRRSGARLVLMLGDAKKNRRKCGFVFV